MRTLLDLCLAGVALACACSPSKNDPTPDASPICGVAYLGDAAKPIDFEFRFVGADGIDKPLKDGDDVPLVFPPQGGRVVFAGVRATNLDPCAVQLTGAVRDLATQQVRVDARTINLIADGTGWGATGAPTQSLSAAVSNYSNVPLCPNQWAATDVFDHPFQLEVTLKDRTKKTLTKTIKVTPRCVDQAGLQADCLCICKVNYTLGEMCAADAGPTDGGDQ